MTVFFSMQLPVKLSPAVVESWQLTIARGPGKSDREQFLVEDKSGQITVFLRNFLQFDDGPKILSILITGTIRRQHLSVTDEVHTSFSPSWSLWQSSTAALR